MAKKKEIGDTGANTETTEVKVESENNSENEANQENTSTQQSNEEKTQSVTLVDVKIDEKTVTNKPAEVSNEIPDEVKKILQQYKNEKELYVDRSGGVFVKGTKPALVKNAILYKNPFYNK